jgi:alanyl-tRNA synthetase
MAWEFLTKTVALPKSKLRVSVHNSDDEAARLWTQIAGLSEVRAAAAAAAIVCEHAPRRALAPLCGSGTRTTFGPWVRACPGPCARQQRGARAGEGAGPCGPCTEIFWDQGREVDGDRCTPHRPAGATRETSLRARAR